MINGFGSPKLLFFLRLRILSAMLGNGIGVRGELQHVLVQYTLAIVFLATVCVEWHLSFVASRQGKLALQSPVAKPIHLT